MNTERTRICYANLKPQPMRYAVYRLGEGRWHRHSRLTTYHTAYRWAEELEKKRLETETDLSPVYIATSFNPTWEVKS